MKREDWDRFVVVMGRYDAAFPNHKGSDIDVADRFQALRDLDIEALEGAVPDTRLACGDFYPSLTLQYDIAVAWTKAERERRANELAKTHGLPERASMSAQEALEAEREALAARARIRKLLAQPMPPDRPVVPRSTFHVDRNKLPEKIKDIIDRVLPTKEEEERP